MGIILPDVSHFTLEVSKLHPCLLPFVHPPSLPPMPSTIETFHRTKMYTAGVAMFNWFDQVMMHQTTTDFQKIRRFDVFWGVLPEILLIDKILQQLESSGHDFMTITDLTGKLASTLKVTKLMFITGQRDSPMTKDNLLGLFSINISNTFRTFCIASRWIASRHHYLDIFIYFPSSDFHWCFPVHQHLLHKNRTTSNIFLVTGFIHHKKPQTSKHQKPWHPDFFFLPILRCFAANSQLLRSIFWCFNDFPQRFAARLWAPTFRGIPCLGGVGQTQRGTDRGNADVFGRSGWKSTWVPFVWHVS